MQSLSPSYQNKYTEKAEVELVLKVLQQQIGVGGNYLTTGVVFAFETFVRVVTILLYSPAWLQEESAFSQFRHPGSSAVSAANIKHSFI